MKTLIIIVATCLGWSVAHAQEKKIFSLSPMSKETRQVNGMVIGIGHFDRPEHIQRINGLNMDVMVLSPLVLLHNLDGGYVGIDSRRETTLYSNGMNLAIGGYFDGVRHNGLSVAMYNFSNEINGLGLHVTYNSVISMNGIHLSGFANLSQSAKGIMISIHNDNKAMRGIQLGVYNKSINFTGLQIGLFNTTDALRGLQLGFWNRNGKRSLPFINF